LTLTNPQGSAALGTPSTAVLTLFENDLPAVTILTRPYFPIASGNFWTHRVDGVCCVITTVLPGTTTIRGMPTTALHSSADGYIQYFTNDSNGVRLHGEFDPGTGITVAYNPPIVLAFASMTTGQTAYSNGIAETTVGDFSYSASFTLRDFTTVMAARSFSVSDSRVGYRCKFWDYFQHILLG
jgi:hypothetical protein